jgi:hypothetical protein
MRALKHDSHERLVRRKVKVPATTNLSNDFGNCCRVCISLGVIREEQMICVVVGIVISMISYSCASAVASSGGTGYYTVFYGAIAIGAIYLIVGLFKMLLGR